MDKMKAPKKCVSHSGRNKTNKRNDKSKSKPSGPQNTNSNRKKPSNTATKRRSSINNALAPKSSGTSAANSCAQSGGQSVVGSKERDTDKKEDDKKKKDVAVKKKDPERKVDVTQEDVKVEPPPVAQTKDAGSSIEQMPVGKTPVKMDDGYEDFGPGAAP